nr:thiamine-phosphate kinase [bacterium endosymbiont of Pedicinus badii]
MIRPENQKDIIITTNLMVCGIHFFSSISPSNLAEKLFRTSVSDIAAMGGIPNYILLSITMPSIKRIWIKEFSRKFLLCLKKYRIDLIGGDISRGPLSINATTIGYVERKSRMMRSGARNKDLIYVTGNLGDSLVGLKILEKQIFLNNKKDSEYFVNKHIKPKIRLYCMNKIRNFINSAIDISDGVIKDLDKILYFSNCGAKIFLDKIPTSKKMSKIFGKKKSLYYAINGGEDQEICFTIKKKYKEKIEKFFFDTGIKCTNIGKILMNRKIIFVKNKKIINYPWKGYEHFEN